MLLHQNDNKLLQQNPWNHRSNAGSNRSQPQASPNAVPATKNDAKLLQQNPWNHRSNARSHRSQPQASPNAVPATKNDAKFLQQNPWNHRSNARSNRSQHQASPNAVPATKKRRQVVTAKSVKSPFQCAKQQKSTSSITKCCTCREKRCQVVTAKSVTSPFQCAEQQESTSSITKCCTCHEKKTPSCYSKIREITVPMRAATGVNLKHHQMLYLPRINYAKLLQQNPWNPFQCAEQQESTSSITKCCTCHQKKTPSCYSKIREITVPMRGATEVNLKHHQMLCLRRKNDISRYELKVPKTGETSVPMRDRSENDPSMIREWNRQSATRGATEVTFRANPAHFVWKNTTFHAPAIIQDFTKYCACHEKWRCNITKYCTCHEKWRQVVRAKSVKSPFQCAEQQESTSSLNAVPATKKWRQVVTAKSVKSPFQCAEQQESTSSITKCCACDEKMTFQDMS